MVLENDAVYNAIELLSDNGYVVIDNSIFSLIIGFGIAIVFVIGFFVGHRDWKIEKWLKS